MHFWRNSDSAGSLFGSQDDVNTRIGVDDSTHFVDFESESGILEGLLHHSPLELAEISAFLIAGAVRVFAGEFGYE